MKNEYSPRFFPTETLPKGTHNRPAGGLGAGSQPAQLYNYRKSKKRFIVKVSIRSLAMALDLRGKNNQSFKQITSEILRNGFSVSEIKGKINKPKKRC